MSDLEIMPRRKGLSSRRVGITKKWPARTSAPADQPTKRQQTFSSPMVTGESTDSVRLSEQERRIAIKAAWIAAGKPNPATWTGHDSIGHAIPQGEWGCLDPWEPTHSLRSGQFDFLL